MEVSDIKGSKTKSCWSLSLVWRASSTVNSCNRARWSISKSTKKILDHILHSVHKKRLKLWQEKPWQCICLQCPKHSAVLGREEHHHWEQHSYSHNLVLCDFSLPQAQGDHQRSLFWRCEGHNRIEGHPRRILPAVHSLFFWNWKKSFATPVSLLFRHVGIYIWEREKQTKIFLLSYVFFFIVLN